MTLLRKVSRTRSRLSKTLMNDKHPTKTPTNSDSSNSPPSEISKERSDSETTVAELRTLVDEFVAERDWSCYHSPKNLAMSIAIEAAELMEHFQWIDSDASREVAEDVEKRSAAGEELADVVAYCFAMAGAMKLDISQIIRDKMLKNHLKYPADVYRGKPSYE